jgi:hypothetical protein
MDFEWSSGDTLFFVGRKDGGVCDEHFKNFEIGKGYEISTITYVSYDLDDITGYSSYCVLFENSMYGCQVDYVNDYFVTQEEWRSSQIEKTISNDIKK